MATSTTEEDPERFKRLELEVKALEEYLKRDFRLTTVVQKSNVPLPKAILLTGDVAENARFFKASWANYLVASGNAGASEEEKKALLLSSIGEECFRRYENMPLTVEDRATSDALIAAIEKHLVPDKNHRYERAMFNMTKQNPEESIDVYVNRLKTLAKTCAFRCSGCARDLSEEFMLDKLCISIKNVRQRAKLYDDKEITLHNAINKVRVAELSEKQLKEIASNGEEKVQQVQHKNFRAKNSSGAKSKYSGSSTASKKKTTCNFCGYEAHDDKRSCPAFGKKCNFCKGANHFSSVCFKKKTNDTKVKAIECEFDSSEEDDQFQSDTIYSVETGDNHNKGAVCPLKFVVNNDVKRLNCLLDTGASCNVIGLENYKALIDAGASEVKLRRTSIRIRGFGDKITKPVGEATLTVLRRKQIFEIPFIVVTLKQIPLISMTTCEQLKLIKICATVEPEPEAETIINKYSDVFVGIGELDGDISLEIDPNVKPVIQVARRVPVKLKQDLREIIDDLEKQNLIAKVNVHTDWVSNVLLVKREGKLRVCLDPVDLNKALKRVNYQMPTVEEIMPELSKAKVFTTLDARRGFWQMRLTDESSYLTTFWTPFGRYRWKRMPFGIAPAPELFQMKQHEIVQGLEGVEVICDDLLVYGCGDTTAEAIIDHNRKLEKLLQRLREKNMKLNKSKMRLCQPSVRFFGHLLTSEGVKADPLKIAAIERMPEPKNVKEVQTFLGMITYLAKFLPSLSTIAEPLRELARDDAEFVWDTKQRNCFEKLRLMVMSSPVLEYYDCNTDVMLQCDASGTGLGAVLLQRNKPIAFASRTLTKTEQNYAQIEKELLAILFGCKRFEQYLIGRSFVVESDHKPLEQIYKKPLICAPKRLQRMLLAMQRYCYSITFVPGSKMYIADLLSRLHMSDTEELQYEDVYCFREEKLFFQELENINPVDCLPISDERVETIRDETQKDVKLQKLTSIIINGWPDQAQQVQADVRAFFKHRQELSVIEGLVFKGHRIVIPDTLQADMINRLHHAHHGVEMTLKLARDALYWPGITQHIKTKIENCNACIKFSSGNRKLSMQSVQIPKYPFQVVSMDICELDEGSKKRRFLILVDHYSDFYEVDEIPNMEAVTVIKCCKRNFARHGVPEILLADNQSNFKSQEFLQFASEWEFKFTTSAPYHHEANGRAEAAVKSAKQLIKKTTADDKDLYQALLASRNTPNKMNASPAQRIFSRRTRNVVPFTIEALKPKVMERVEEAIEDNRMKIKHYADRKSRGLKPLQIGQSVFVKLKGNSSPWVEAAVVGQQKDRAYEVQVGNQKYVRDRVHIKPAGLSKAVSNEEQQRQQQERQQQQQQRIKRNVQPPIRYGNLVPH